ncbi:hypothetical protein Ocin01_01335, partial [Orchesella cincta]
KANQRSPLNWKATTIGLRVSVLLRSSDYTKSRHEINSTESGGSGTFRPISSSVISSKTSYTLVTIFVVIFCLAHVHNCDARPYQSNRSSSGGIHNLLPCGHRDTTLEVEVRSGRSSHGSTSVLTNCV